MCRLSATSRSDLAPSMSNGRPTSLKTSGQRTFDEGLVAEPAGPRVQSVEPNAAVEERRASGRAVDEAVEHQDAAVARPGRFELALGDDQPRGGAARNRQANAPSAARSE